jgi:hypothetical protein
MKRAMAVMLGVALMMAAGVAQAAQDGWISLFDGKSLNGWKASENPQSFKVEDGVIVVFGPRAHLFYVGEVKSANFRNFEFKAEVMTFPKANSGLFIHTEYQEKGWPGKGYEVQINQTHSDPRKTASIYAVKDIMNVPPARDNEWFELHIIVNGKQITVRIDGKTVNEYTEGETRGNRRLSSGTFAIQAHDPESKVLVRNIQVKPLAD